MGGESSYVYKKVVNYIIVVGMGNVLKYFTYIIIVFSIVTLIDLSNKAGQNVIMLGVMSICPIVLLAKIRNVELNDLIFAVLFILLLLSYYLHPNTFRLSTVLFSGMFMAQFVTYKILSKRYIDIYLYRKLLVSLIYLFFAVLVVQQISRLGGIPVFNSWNYEELKFNSLAQEPSALPPTIIIMLFSIIKVDEVMQGHSVQFKTHFRCNSKLWLAFFYMIFTCGSTTGIFILPIFLIYFYRKKVLINLPLICISLIIIFYVFSFISPFVIDRLIAVSTALLSLDPLMIYDADQSASARLAPYLIYFADMNIFSSDFWFGHGVDYGVSHLSYILLGFVDEERTFGIGGLVNFMYDYGFIAFVLLIVYLRRNIFKSFFSYDFLLWFLIFTVQSFNVSLFWLPVILMYTNNMLEIRYANHNVFKSNNLKV